MYIVNMYVCTSHSREFDSVQVLKHTKQSISLTQCPNTHLSVIPLKFVGVLR